MCVSVCDRLTGSRRNELKYSTNVESLRYKCCMWDRLQSATRSKLLSYAIMCLFIRLDNS